MKMYKLQENSDSLRDVEFYQNWLSQHPDEHNTAAGVDAQYSMKILQVAHATGTFMNMVTGFNIDAYQEKAICEFAIELSNQAKGQYVICRHANGAFTVSIDFNKGISFDDTDIQKTEYAMQEIDWMLHSTKMTDQIKSLLEEYFQAYSTRS